MFTVKKIILYIFGFALLSLITAAIYFYFVLKPSNSRNWEAGMETLPAVAINGNQVNVKNIRDYHYQGNQTVSTGYIEKTFDVSKLAKVWFVVEPFTIKPFTGFKGVAHTYFVFDFTDQDPVVVSVEARREKGEKYDAWIGLLNQYELIYIWGTEQDETVSRVTVENNRLYMYPLQISPEAGQKLFLQIAQATHNLEATPRFYNTFLSNCTNELAKAANQVKPNSVPLNIALFLPGYSDEQLYKLGYIPHDKPLEEIQRKYYISDFVSKFYSDSNFSQELRQNLN